MLNEKEFRKKVSEIEDRIPEAFKEDPYSYLSSDEERQFFKKNMSLEALQKKFDEINARHLEKALARALEDKRKYSADAKTLEEKKKKEKEFDDYLNYLGGMSKEELDAYIKQDDTKDILEVIKDWNKKNK